MSFIKDIFGVMLLEMVAQRNDFDLGSNQNISLILLMVLSLNHEIHENDCRHGHNHSCCNSRHPWRDEFSNCGCATPYHGIFPGIFR